VDILQEDIWGSREERKRSFYMQERMDTHKGSIYRKTQKTREGFVREPTPVEMSVGEDEMINRIYGSLL